MKKISIFAIAALMGVFAISCNNGNEKATDEATTQEETVVTETQDETTTEDAEANMTEATEENTTEDVVAVEGDEATSADSKIVDDNKDVQIKDQPTKKVELKQIEMQEVKKTEESKVVNDKK